MIFNQYMLKKLKVVLKSEYNDVYGIQQGLISFGVFPAISSVLLFMLYMNRYTTQI